MSLVIIGGGNMGGAIARALIQAHILRSEEILMVEMDAEKHSCLSQQLGCKVIPGIDAVLSDYNTIILAVKPQGSVPVMKELSPFLQPRQLILSIMAGVSTATLTEHLNHEAVVRVMPNTPAQIGEGMSAFFATAQVTPEQRNYTKTLFSACGKCLEVPTEDAIDAVTAVSGSGPAYVFYVAEQMMEAAQTLGFSIEDATQMVMQTMKGAVLLWEQKNVSAETLRRQVTSPGGTTEAALRYFEEQQTGNSLQQGIQCAYQRAGELSKTV